jgi:hypothetical protein
LARLPAQSAWIVRSWRALAARPSQVANSVPWRKIRARRALARLSSEWNPSLEKKSRKFKKLERVLFRPRVSIRSESAPGVHRFASERHRVSIHRTAFSIGKSETAVAKSCSAALVQPLDLSRSCAP